MSNDKFMELKHKYNHQVPAEALFINAGHKALRLECPEIGKEFTDNVYIGKGGRSFVLAAAILTPFYEDPEGLLFYSHFSSFNSNRTIHYIASRIVNPYDNKVCCWIRFYSTSIDNCHAEVRAINLPLHTPHSYVDDYFESSSSHMIL